MPLHLGTTFGLIGSAIITAAAGVKAHREGWDVLDTMQGKWTGYSFWDAKNRPEEAWKATRPTAAYCLIGGAAITRVAKWTDYNQDTPKGWNI